MSGWKTKHVKMVFLQLVIFASVGGNCEIWYDLPNSIPFESSQQHQQHYLQLKLGCFLSKVFTLDLFISIFGDTKFDWHVVQLGIAGIAQPPTILNTSPLIATPTHPVRHSFIPSDL